MKVTSLAVAALVPLLASCTSMGLYNMSDDWCTAHRDATAARCPVRDQQRVVHNDGERVADNDGRRSD